MTWEVETEQEVTDWYLGLSGNDRDVVAERVDLLANLGHMLRMPHARPLGEGPLGEGPLGEGPLGEGPLGEGLFELRFACPAGRGGPLTGTA